MDFSSIRKATEGFERLSYSDALSTQAEPILFSLLRLKNYRTVMESLRKKTLLLTEPMK